MYKNLISQIILFVCFIPVIIGQHGYFSNDFDNNINFDITINDTLWQVGQPEKELFNKAIFEQNSLITSLVNNYPINSNASFDFGFHPMEVDNMNFFILEWYQRMDVEEGVDGYLIELDYSDGNGWINLFEDEIYHAKPIWDLEGEVDTLYTGQKGVSKNSTDSNHHCGIGWEISNLEGVEFIKFRFTFVSDTNDTQQEGVMFDRFYAEQDWVCSNEYPNSNRIHFKITPNPATNQIRVLMDVLLSNATIVLYNMVGRKLIEKNLTPTSNSYPLDIASLPNGVYFLELISHKKRSRQKVVIQH